MAAQNSVPLTAALLLALIALAAEVKCQLRVELGATRSVQKWIVQNPNKSISVPAQVPGGIYSDLESASIFSNPIYYGFNDVETRWVGRENWTFSRHFNVDQRVLEQTQVFLVLEGVDTVSTVWINGQVVGTTENMFVRYIFQVKQFLKPSNNTIELSFQSPIAYSLAAYNEQAKSYAVPPTCVPKSYNGECHANHIRKMQASFSWDWGPAYPSSGIYKDIYLEGVSGGVIRDILVFTTSNNTAPDETANTAWNLTVRVFLQSSEIPEGDDLDTLRMKLKTGRRKHFSVTRKFKLKKGAEQVEQFTILVPGDQVKLWWPNGYGSQPLYNLSVKYTSTRYKLYSKKIVRMGFRTVELVQDPVDDKDGAKGLTFYFRINNLPIYAKGSNMIPIHVLPEKVTAESTEWLLKSAAMTHTNMIRIWGGGIYETDLLYSLADQYGIMIWQDFMFACAMYPVRDQFLESVEQEIEAQVRRLHHHPSIVLWAGNNENEAALTGNWYGTSGQLKDRYYEDYRKLYIATVKATLDKLDNSRPFLSSSPTNGKKTEEQNWLADDPYSNLYGDVHFYNYFADLWDTKVYPQTRFASEYGFQSWPHPETLYTVLNRTNVSEVHWESPAMDHRQHLPGGQRYLQLQIDLHLTKPTSPKSASQFENMIYLSQVNQAVAIKTQTEFYRRMMGRLYEDGSGMNMGALYWQLNDIWPGASWASIDSLGRWKLLHYYARKFFAPTILSAFSEGAQLIVNFVSDIPVSTKSVATAGIFKLSNGASSKIYEDVLSMSPTAKPVSRQISTIPDSVYKEKCNQSDSACFLHLSAPGLSDNFLFITYPLKAIVLPNPELKVVNIAPAASRNFSSVWEPATTLEITLDSLEVALFVSLSFRQNNVHHVFSDNGFIMIGPKIVYFESEQIISLTEFQVNFDVESLFEVMPS